MPLTSIAGKVTSVSASQTVVADKPTGYALPNSSETTVSTRRITQFTLVQAADGSISLSQVQVTRSRWIADADGNPTTTPASDSEPTVQAFDVSAADLIAAVGADQVAAWQQSLFSALHAIADQMGR